MGENEKKTELQVAQQTIKFFETLLHASTDGIVITDYSQKIIMANEPFCNIFDMNIRDVIETNLFVWLEQLDGDAPKHWANMEKAVRKEGESRNVDFIKTMNGPVLHMSSKRFSPWPCGQRGYRRHCEHLA